MPRRFPEWVSFLGYAAMAAGFALMFGASIVGVGLAFALGLGVGLVMHIARPYPVLTQLIPPLIAFLTSLAVFAVGGIQDGLEPARLVAAPLVALIPGMALTAGTLELAGGHIISGASRLVWGIMQLVLIASGIVAGAYAARVDAWNPSDQAAVTTPAWFPLIGVLVVAVGQLLYFNEPAGIVKWLLPLLMLAFIIQTIAGLIVGSIASGGVAAAIILPIALQIERRRRGSAPPALITFQPVFWLLVPGSLGVLGLTEALINGIGGTTDLSAAGFLFAMAGGILAIVLGTQIGSLIGWAFTRVTEVVPDMVLRAVGVHPTEPEASAPPAPPAAGEPSAG
jgi:vacuolar-type H+-ATPase subunit I/STV1